MFLCPARPELTSRRPGWGGGRRNFSSLALDPLDHDEAEHLIRALLAIDDLPDGVRSRILERGEGNPFFLEEILRHLIDGGHVFFEDGRWRAASCRRGGSRSPTPCRPCSPPGSISSSRAAKRLLQGAAVVGRDFWPGPARLLGGADANDLEPSLRVLQDRDLIVSRLSSRISGEREFTFKHVLTRDVAYESLPHRERPGGPCARSRVDRNNGRRPGRRVQRAARVPLQHRLPRFPGGRNGRCRVGTAALQSLRVPRGSLERLPPTASAEEGTASWPMRRSHSPSGPLERSLGARLAGSRVLRGGRGGPRMARVPGGGRGCERARSRHPTPWCRRSAPAGRATCPPAGPVRCGPFPRKKRSEPASTSACRISRKVRARSGSSCLMVRATWAFAYPERGFTDEEFVETRAGRSRRLRDGDAARASRTSPRPRSTPRRACRVRKDTGRVRSTYSRMREQLLPVLTDLDEVGDVTSCAAWNYYEVGEYAGGGDLGI